MVLLEGIEQRQHLAGEAGVNFARQLQQEVQSPNFSCKQEHLIGCVNKRVEKPCGGGSKWEKSRRSWEEGNCRAREIFFLNYS